MKKAKSITALLLALSICAVTACSSQPTDSSSKSSSAESMASSEASEAADSTTASDTSSEASAENSSDTSSKPEKPVTDFTTYVSNTVVSTGNNFYIEKAENITYRAYLPVEQYGELEYKFFFTNTVDSTYAKGKDAFVGKDGGTYTVSNAVIADGGTSTEDEITNRTPVTFGGKTTKEVASDESYWSDPVTMNIPEGHYLVWEWTVSGEGIPCNKMSTLTSTTSSADGETFAYCDDIPLPQLIGAKRGVKIQ